MLDAVKTRLEDQVSSLAGRVEPAADLAALLRDNGMPQAEIAAHVVPLGLRPGRADIATGLYRQPYQEAVSVVVYWKTYDARGADDQGDLRTLVMAVVAALCGWGPDGSFGVFELLRGQLISMRTGTMIYQIDVAISDQLRIQT